MRTAFRLNSLITPMLVAGTMAFSAGAALAQKDCPTDLPLAEAGKLTMSINATIPPKQYINEDGDLVGLHVDLGNEIAKRLCLEPVYANVSFEVQIPGLQSKRWDMINTGLYFTEDRAKIMYLIPYTINALALIVADGNPLNVAGPEDLAGHIVGVEIAGFEEKKIREINEEQVAAGLEPMDIRVFNTYGDTFLALGAGQVEAVFAGDAIGKYYQDKGKFTMAVTGLFPGSPGAFATIEPELGNAIADVLNDMLADGTYVEMMDSQGATKIDTWTEWDGTFKAWHTEE
ncbi:ABC transporter substrate-binding protein [Devosia sp.]|uniref:ABC transporter substrate-binding protein n=1 Tax=Devosia sp. TaxID=1871048 RepID=UPI003A92374E